jgi:hypothetical protein
MLGERLANQMQVTLNVLANVNGSTELNESETLPNSERTRMHTVAVFQAQRSPVDRGLCTFTLSTSLHRHSGNGFAGELIELQSDRRTKA